MMPKNVTPDNLSESYSRSVTEIRSDAKPSAETYRHSRTLSPQNAPAHGNRRPQSKHSRMTESIHPDVRLHLPKTTPTHDTGKLFRVDIKSSRNYYTTIHNTDNFSGNNLRRFPISNPKHTTSATAHNRNKIATSHREALTLACMDTHLVVLDIIKIKLPYTTVYSL